VQKEAARSVLRRKKRNSSQSELWPDSEEHVWQRRFYDFNVWSARKRIEKLRYMHRNPVKGGLALEPEQWQWSSFRSYAFQEVGRVRVSLWPSLS
jgi:putative transposase